MTQPLKLAMNALDPVEDHVGGLLLLLSGWMLDHLEPEGLAIADRHPRELHALPVTYLL
jgi:hypothetical protein